MTAEERLEKKFDFARDLFRRWDLPPHHVYVDQREESAVVGIPKKDGAAYVICWPMKRPN